MGFGIRDSGENGWSGSATIPAARVHPAIGWWAVLG